jgi:hypothetical protein
MTTTYVNSPTTMPGSRARVRALPALLNVLAFYRGAEGDVGRNALFGMKPRGSDPPGARLGTQARLHAAWEISTIGSLPTVTANSLA